MHSEIEFKLTCLENAVQEAADILKCVDRSEPYYTTQTEIDADKWLYKWKDLIND